MSCVSLSASSALVLEAGAFSLAAWPPDKSKSVMMSRLTRLSDVQATSEYEVMDSRLAKARP